MEEHVWLVSCPPIRTLSPGNCGSLLMIWCTFCLAYVGAALRHCLLSRKNNPAEISLQRERIYS